MRSQKYDVLELFRFVSALAIMFHHMPLGVSGGWGVNLFFMISGFVMMECTRSDDRHFFRKRLIRIVPLYWLLTLAVFAIAFSSPKLMNNTTADFHHLIKSLFFIPFNKHGSGHAPILFVGWTLNYEMFFYLIFGLSVAISVKYRAIISTAILGGTMAALSYENGFLSGVFSSVRLMDFAAGMLIHTLANFSSEQRQIIASQLATMLAFALVSAHELAYENYSASLACFMVMGAAVVLLKKSPLPPLVSTLGAATYVMYLSHAFVIQAFDKILGAFDTHQINAPHHDHHLWSQSAVILLITLIVVVSSVFIHRKFELPLNAMLRRRFLSSSCTTPRLTPRVHNSNENLA